MWNEIEKDIKLYEECNYLNIDQEPVHGIGNEKAKVVIVFDKVTHSMFEKRGILDSFEYEKLKVIFDFAKIDIKECYFTCLNKYYNKMQSIDYDKRKYAMSIFLKEIYLIEPEYIVSIGEDIFNYLYKYYTKKETNIDILKNVGKIFGFYGKKLVPIYDIEYISKLSKEKKRELIKVLKEITK
ncbi:hypothetical protein [Oceanivirga salmonicida]|uniref:hypothetical protein n=1 Tax=Oceanivirga salmonicida TaxID=1769291 RepID=UPI0008367FE3|nr:hypothetical protein [Oceanivirga salmonicida]